MRDRFIISTSFLTSHLQPDRVSRPVQGNGPIEDLTLIDLQCGGYTAGGISGSEPAALHAQAAAGSTVSLRWTLWPDSHVGPAITYMARCPDSGCDDWLPGTEYVPQSYATSVSILFCMLT